MTELDPYAAPTAEADIDEQPYQPKIFAFSGRVGRLRYIAYGTIYYFVFGLGLIAVSALLGVFAGNAEGIEEGSRFWVVMIVVYLTMVVMWVAIAVRRMNDLDKSGWWLLLFFVPLVNFFMILYLLFFPGTVGTNKYGPKPVKNHPALWLGLLFPFVIGILAAIALPAYQDYVERAKAAQNQMN